MPRAPIISIFRMIQEAEYYIRTAYGDSTITINGRLEEKLYQGILQGNGSGSIT